MATTSIDVLCVSDKVIVPPDTLDHLRLCIVTASTAEAAIERLQGIDFDVVLADIDLPREDLTKLFRLIELQQPEALAVRINFAQAESFRQTLAGFAQQVYDSRKTIYHFVENPWTV